MKLIPVAAVGAVALSLAACGSGATGTAHGTSVRGRLASVSASRPTRIYTIPLSGKAEAPLGPAAGRGVAIIAFHGDSIVCWRFAHLHGFTSATFANIRSAIRGRAGAIVAPLSTGRRLYHQGCVSLSPVLTKAIWSTPSRYYVNIDSSQYPHGAVLGQL